MLQEDSDVFYLISSPGRMNSSKRQYTVLVSFSFSGFRGHCLHALDLLFFFGVSTVYHVAAYLKHMFQGFHCWS